MDDNYQAYLVRFVRSDHASAWRAVLQDVRGNEIHHFASEKGLFMYLMKQLVSNSELPDVEDAADGSDSGVG